MTDFDDARLTALASRVAEAARAASRRLATAESCTGGWIAKVLTDLPGSSAWFQGGVVAYSNGAKSALLAVPGRLIDLHGAVSAEVAKAMVLGALPALAADLAVSVTGIAGPDGGSADKPVGSVWLGIADAGRPAQARLECFAGDRECVRRATVACALGLLASALES